MLNQKYTRRIKHILKKHAPKGNAEMFLFGSSVSRDRFGDCDIGIRGNITDPEIRRIREAFANSTLPYRVDVVNFNTVSKKFQNQVFQSPIVWIHR